MKKVKVCALNDVNLLVRSYGPSLGVMYYNNLGVIHLGMGKPTVACLYLQKALQETQVKEENNSSGNSGMFLV